MSAAPQRDAIRHIVDGFFSGWSQGDWHHVSHSIALDAQLLSNQHPFGIGPDGFKDALAGDTVRGHFQYRTSNHYVGGHDGEGVASAYAFGLIQRGASFLLFGATVVMTFRCAEDGTWLLTLARLSINWQQGDTALVDHWSKPPENYGWQLGDAPPVLVSELDSPWAKVSNSTLVGSVEESVAELYSKYSWAIDQGDIALLSDCYTDDAAGGFSPMGQLRGRHAIIGQLKSFRRQWPWMQHFADVVHVELEEDGVHARMIVARIIPERTADTSGRTVYGAHYQIRARLESDGLWRICWSDYRAGWFSEDDIPSFDLGRTDA